MEDGRIGGGGGKRWQGAGSGEVCRVLTISAGASHTVALLCKCCSFPSIEWASERVPPVQFLLLLLRHWCSECHAFCSNLVSSWASEVFWVTGVFIWGFYSQLERKLATLVGQCASYDGGAKLSILRLATAFCGWIHKFKPKLELGDLFLLHLYNFCWCWWHRISVLKMSCILEQFCDILSFRDFCMGCH